MCNCPEEILGSFDLCQGCQDAYAAQQEQWYYEEINAAFEQATFEDIAQIHSTL